ncbi:tRNA (guanine(37)-N1)-methyltransferase [Mactra antiquata]
MLKGIRFALKRRIFHYRVIPKPSSKSRRVDTVPESSKDLKKEYKIRPSFSHFTHCCSFQHFNFKQFDFLELILKMDDGKQSIDSPTVLKPPSCVKGMTSLEKSKFDLVSKVPSLIVPVTKLKVVTKLLKNVQLKKHRYSAVVELTECDPKFSSHRRYLLDPEKVQSVDTVSEKLQSLDNYTFSISDFEMVEVKLTYENWSFSEIMQAVMPDDSESVAGFSQVGHIAHFNLRSQALPYKHLIGEVLLDKLAAVRTVVNKLDTIDNTYRTFQMELLAGENNFITRTKENGFTFELDFSKVYWNSRLGTEHLRRVDHLTCKDIVFDVFAGIGPFAVPAAKYKAQVFANDLNPSSYESLTKNITLNKCDPSRIRCYNLDGREFITTIMKQEIMKIYSSTKLPGDLGHEVNESDVVIDSMQDINSISVLMNLPALAYTFVDAFRGLLCELEYVNTSIPLPVVHCYCFTNSTEADVNFNGDVDKELKHRIIDRIGYLKEEDISVRFVRDVAPKKLMKCVSFSLTEEILCHNLNDLMKTKDENDCDENEEPPTKSRRLNENL